MVLQVGAWQVANWQLAAFSAMLMLAAYGIAAKQFFNKEHDWRAFIPLVLIAALMLTAYFFYSGAHTSVGSDSYAFALLLGAIFALSTVFSFVAIKEGPVSVVVPIFSMNLVLVAIAGALLFGEKMSAYKVAGIALGLVSIFLLAVDT